MNQVYKSNSQHTRVLFIALDAVDWKLASTKIAAGELPNLARLMTSGASGPLRSLHPLFSPALWSTIATGKRPYEHGIIGFTLPDEAGTGLKSYDSTTRTSPAFWNILSKSNKTSNIIGWWTTSPAEEIQGVMIDETFRIARSPLGEPWPVNPNSVSPTSRADELKKLRVHPQEISEVLLRELVPKLYEIDLTTDLRIAGIAKILAEDLTNLEIALHLMKQPNWDLTSVYLIGLDSLSHQGMLYREPTLLGKNSRDNDLYGELVDRAYQLYDRWLGKLLEAAGKETSIILLSDHGFYHDHRKPTTLGIEATAPCIHHAPTGTLVVAGPQIKKNVRIQHASLLDICPTLLALLDLPAGRDMPGHVLQQIFSSPTNKKRIASWNPLCNQSPQKRSLDKPSAQTTEAALLQLVALGYLPELPTDHRTATKEAHVSELLHTALAYLNNEQLHHAIPLLEQARTQAPRRTDVLAELGNAYLLINEHRKAAANYKQLVRARYQDAHQSWRELERKMYPKEKPSIAENWALRRLLARAHVHDDGMFFTTSLASWIAHRRKEDLEQMISLAKKYPHDAFMSFHVGRACLSANLEKEGLDFLRQAASWKNEEADALANIADYENKNNNTLQAEATAREALERDPLHAASWLALSTSLIAQQRWQEAKDAAKRASVSGLRKNKACQLLAEIALQENKDHDLARRYQKVAERSEKRLKSFLHNDKSSQKKNDTEHVSSSSVQKEVRLKKKLLFPKASTLKHPIVVTGLPRSGTSLLMQMLAAGGLPIFTDHHRLSDQHNPRGYFEHEKIKSIATNQQFLKEASGKAVKIVIPLLWELSKNFNGSILWIQRDLEEVIASQKKMSKQESRSEELLTAYHYYETKTIEIIEQRKWSVLKLLHSSVLLAPQKTATQIHQFLETPLNTAAMAEVVTPSLYRTKKN